MGFFPRLRRRTRSFGPSHRGFALLETVIGLASLSIAMGGLISALLVCSRLREMNECKAKARNAAEQVLSAMRGMEGLVEAYERFGGGGAEEAFTITGLADIAANDPAGRVIVWRRKSSLKNTVNPPQPDPGSALVLPQDELLQAQAAFSNAFPNIMEMMAEMPGTAWDDFLDTNTDGLVDAADDPQMLPVTVRIRWRSPSGITAFHFSAVIGRR